MTDALRLSDPTLNLEFPTDLDQRASQDLEAILTSRPAPARRRMSFVAATAAAVVAALVVGSVWLARPPAASAQPVALPILSVQPLSGSTVTASSRLLTLAQAAARAQTAPGPIQYRDWAMNLRVADARVDTAIVTTEHILATNPDQSIHVTVRIADIDYPTPASRSAWEQNAPVTVGDMLEDMTYPAGQRPVIYPEPAPTTEPALTAFFKAGHPIDEYGTGELFVAVTDLAKEQRLTGPQQSAILRLIATSPDVITLGTVRDRAGRSGIAFATDSSFTGLPTRHVLVVDPDSGRLLASETWLTSSAGKLGITAPAATEYTVLM